MDITQLLATRDAVRAIVADASIAQDDKKQIVSEAIKGLNVTSLSTAPHLRRIICAEFNQHLDNLCKEQNAERLSIRSSAGEHAQPSSGQSDSRPERDQKVPSPPKGPQRRR